ncbi:hypothetical protein ACI2OX_04110 [Bacillus sp. N9]
MGQDQRGYRPELLKRDVHVTLGGHSLSYLLADQLDQKDKLGFFSGNSEHQNRVIRKIVDTCKENEVVKRISLWPEDTGLDEIDASNFYLTILGLLKC